MLYGTGGQAGGRYMGHMGQLVDVIFSRLQDKAANRAALGCGFCSLRAGDMILGIAMGAANRTQMGVVQIAAGGPFACIQGVIFRGLCEFVAANLAQFAMGAGGIVSAPMGAAGQSLFAYGAVIFMSAFIALPGACHADMISGFSGEGF